MEREIAKQDRRNRVQDLDKHRTEAAYRYRTALKKLAKNRDDTAFLNDPIMPGDLIMREPLNRKSKLHPRWDGPFVILGATDKDVYQLATANGYTLPNLHNVARLRKLDKDERIRYAGDFWDASNRLKLYDRIAKEQSELNDVNKRLADATRRHLEDQRQTTRTDRPELTEIAQIAKEKREKENALREARVEQEKLAEEPTELRQSGRIRKTPVRFENA